MKLSSSHMQLSGYKGDDQKILTFQSWFSISGSKTPYHCTMHF